MCFYVISSGSCDAGLRLLRWLLLLLLRLVS